MDQASVKSLLGGTIYSRAERYYQRGRVKDLSVSESAPDTLYVTASVQGSGEYYDVEIWLRKNGTYRNASCTCPYNERGEGAPCKHIGAVLLRYIDEYETEEGTQPPTTGLDRALAVPGVTRASELARRQAAEQSGLDQNAAGTSLDAHGGIYDEGAAGSAQTVPAGAGAQGGANRAYSSNLEMLFGRKWRGAEAVSDDAAGTLLHRYENADFLRGEELVPHAGAAAEAGSVTLEPELTLDPFRRSAPPELRVRIGAGGRKYIIKSIPDLLDAIDRGAEVSYGAQLTFVHRPEVFDEPAQKLLALLRTQVGMMRYASSIMRTYGMLYTSKNGALPLMGQVFEALFDLYYTDGLMSGYFLEKGCPAFTLESEKRRGGVALSIRPRLNWYDADQHFYFFDENTIWRTERGEALRLTPALEALGEKNVFFTQKDATAFCSYVLPELRESMTLHDPERVLLDQIPLVPVVQFYLDAPQSTVLSAHAEFVYGEDRVTPFAVPLDTFRRDARTENKTARLLQRWLHPSAPGVFETAGEEALYRFLEEGVPALMAAGEVYLTDKFRALQVTPPKITVGVSVSGSMLDLDVDTGEFPAAELKALLDSLHQKKRYHRLRDGRLLRLDESLEVLEDLGETLALSGAKPGQTHAELPLYRAPSLDRALSGQSGVRFTRDDAFRRISRSFHSVSDSEYALPESLQGVLRKYQRTGYRWLRTLDAYGMGGILADDMGLGKTLQVLAYLLSVREGGNALPSLIVCPASLVLNWQEECQKFTPSLKCLAVDGTAAHRAEQAAHFSEYDLVVTSYDLLRRDAALYAEHAFYACIVDEAQAIKNHTTQKYKAVCRVRSTLRFALTGTPVENRLSELWSIFSFLMPGYLFHYKVFCDKFEKPIAQDKNEEVARRLNQLTGPFILRRMKADVLKELPPKIENVYHVNLEAQQHKLYVAAVVDAKKKLRAAKPDDRVAVFAVLTRLRQICCDPRLVADNWTGGSAKLDACADLIASAVEGGHRILLFSQFTSMLAILEKKLDELNICHFTLEGSTPKPRRAELVHRFNDGEASVFLISLKAGGTGLNLTAADIVIHYDPWWNVAAQNQATDRAYRIGQQNTVQVYKLIAQETIEEKIVELQQAKQNLADTVTGSADGAILSMKPDELLELLG